MIFTKDKTRIHKAGVALLKSEDHQILQGRQLILRTRLLEAGKKTKDPAIWTALEWFDKCIRIPDMMAGTGSAKTKEEYATLAEDTDL